MGITFTSREFNQDVSKAKRAADKGPVFITDRGRPAHVLMTVKDYGRLAGKGASIVDLLADTDAAEIDFAPPRHRDHSLRPANLD
jgi:prevent-host-death family protein